MKKPALRRSKSEQSGNSPQRNPTTRAHVGEDPTVIPATRSQAPPEDAAQFRTPPPKCPVLEGCLKISDLSQDMVLALRKLRRDLKACNRCAHFEGCSILGDLSTLVQTAIQEVVDEWDLTVIWPHSR